MVIMSRQDAINLRNAEWCLQGSWHGVVAADDHTPIARWQRWCGNAMFWNAEQGWSTGCHPGRWVGSKLRSPLGTRQALACPLPGVHDIM